MCDPAQIRQLSGARVKLHGGEPNSGERMLEIMGTPEQLATAQRLIIQCLLAE